MEYSEWNGLRISRLTLGTVQFGMSYGIANKTGMPDYKTARDIIARACEGGVNCLDTAAAYGESETVIGKALKELGIKEKMTVVTKIVHLQEKGIGGADAKKNIGESVAGSLKKLGLDVLPLCLFHKGADTRFMDILLELKERGLVARVGSSILGPEELGGALAAGAEAVQTPFNIVDRRTLDDKHFAAAGTGGAAVFARSVYLQGLLLMAESEIREDLRGIIPTRRKLQAIADEAGVTFPELCARHTLGFREITSTLAGVETPEQMTDNIAVFDKGPLEKSVMEKIAAAVPALPERLISPALWNKKQTV